MTMTPTTTTTKTQATEAGGKVSESSERSSTTPKTQTSKSARPSASTTPKTTTKRLVLKLGYGGLHGQSQYVEKKTKKHKITEEELVIGRGEFVMAGLLAPIAIYLTCKELQESRKTTLEEQDARERGHLLEGSSDEGSSPRSDLGGGVEHSDLNDESRVEQAQSNAEEDDEDDLELAVGGGHSGESSDSDLAA